MSSGGPASGNTEVVNESGCFGSTQSSQVPPGYTFSTTSIRDGSDWTAYKKQLLVFKESKAKITSDPWFARGNDYRLQFLLGKYKQPTAETCTACEGGAFNTGPTS
jgi:hypothetical protein